MTMLYCRLESKIWFYFYVPLVRSVADLLMFSIGVGQVLLEHQQLATYVEQHGVDRSVALP